MNMSKRTILKTAPGGFGSVYTLEHRTAGLVVAGSGTRETKEHWASIRTGKNGAVTGQQFSTLEKATANFEQFTTPIIEVLPCKP